MLVVVATRAGNTQPHDCGTYHVDLVGNHIHIKIVVHGLGWLGSNGKKSGGYKVAVALLIVFCL